jgi:hypothetical protein
MQNAKGILHLAVALATCHCEGFSPKQSKNIDCFGIYDASQ